MELARTRFLALVFALAVAATAPSPAAALGAVQLPGLGGDDIRADAGPDRFLVPPATSLTLNGSVEGIKGMRSNEPGADMGILLSWSQVGGPPALVQNASSLRPTIVPSRPGTIRVRFKVVTPIAFDVDEVLVHVLGADQDAVVGGEARKWHKLSLTFTHDQSLSETSTPNPFLDLRLFVQLFHVDAQEIRTVPGFFAADGNAAETSATAGTRWRANFTPDLAGRWYYVASFRAGSQIALSADLESGVSESFDGASGYVDVAPADPTAPGLLSKGRLEYVGKHHLRFAETGEYWLKGGAGSPENFLGYWEFDGTTDQGGVFNDLDTTGAQDGLHHYNPHLGDYVDLGAPLWKNGKGRRLYGALSYLGSRGVSSLYAITFNTDGGDGQEVWPWRTPTDKLRFDVSKLDQWERALDHMNRAGIVWHVVTQETENDHELDGGVLGTQRRLYYRELVARFAHANGLIWNLGEENTNTPEERMDFADAIRALDPYDHPISLHNRVGDIPGTFGTLLGTHLELLSIQGDPTQTPARARQLVLDSAAAGRPWVVNFDEQTPAQDGVLPDVVDFWHDLIRRESLWPMLMGQGGGCEWYFGYGHPNDDLDCEDFRTRENLWQITRRAVEFVQETVPFQDMQHADALAVGNGPSVLAKRGEHYLVYLPFGGAVSLDLEGSSETFLVSWFDARNGGSLQGGAVAQVAGPGVRSLGSPPGPGDWVAFVRRAANYAPSIESVSVEPKVVRGGHEFTVKVHASDPNGPLDPLAVTVHFVAPDGELQSPLELVHRGGSLYSLVFPEGLDIEPLGRWRVVAMARDGNERLDFRATSFVAR